MKKVILKNGKMALVDETMPLEVAVRYGMVGTKTVDLPKSLGPKCPKASPFGSIAASNAAKRRLAECDTDTDDGDRGRNTDTGDGDAEIRYYETGKMKTLFQRDLSSLGLSARIINALGVKRGIYTLEQLAVWLGDNGGWDGITKVRGIGESSAKELQEAIEGIGVTLADMRYHLKCMHPAERESVMQHMRIFWYDSPPSSRKFY